MSITPIAPTRGIIIDKNGVILAENIPVYALEVFPSRIKDLDETLHRLQTLIPSITDDDIERFYHQKKRTLRYLPVPLKLQLTEEELASFAAHQYAFSGVQIKAELMRHYPQGEITAHLLGYVGRMSVDDLNRVDSTNYQATHFVGKTGIERFYEDELHGQVGFQQVETDVTGKTVRTISKQAPISGQKLTLTIDTRLQRRIHHDLYGQEGAVVILDVQHGDVLALVSNPSFDPNQFVRGMSYRQYQTLTDAPEKPLFHRAIRGLYPPASTIKPFIALIGLDKGYIDEHSTIYDPGYFRLPGITHTYRDWKRGGHGLIGLKRALAVSCDTYFYQLGNKIGISTMEDMLIRFGFGQFSFIDLKEEAQGLVPSPLWKKQIKGQSWYPGDTLITAIGQGFMLASPLQMASATASLSLRGKHFRPHLLKSTQTDSGEIQYYKPIEEYPIHIKDKAWKVVIDGMKDVITKREGTGRRFGRDTKYSVAAKTGTAQVFSLSQDEKKRNQFKEDEMPTMLRDHSLFIAFAPIEAPEIAIAVLVEHDNTAPIIARKAMDAYFQLKEKK